MWAYSQHSCICQFLLLSQSYTTFWFILFCYEFRDTFLAHWFICTKNYWFWEMFLTEFLRNLARLLAHWLAWLLSRILPSWVLLLEITVGFCYINLSIGLLILLIAALTVVLSVLLVPLSKILLTKLSNLLHKLSWILKFRTHNLG